ncbi:hypothetical protein EVAR_3652_1 [Eumeta japonica]|uniref:Uncharacterized protein n=1 Tax=Eumeta variegata TaxID=151549 RepID=A0A4C1STW7_EUMVA|nr:hypothetical protein EVAR_3652_1 [Eumeta japonica]
MKDAYSNILRCTSAENDIRRSSLFLVVWRTSRLFISPRPIVAPAFHAVAFIFQCPKLAANPQPRLSSVQYVGDHRPAGLIPPVVRFDSTRETF